MKERADLSYETKSVTLHRARVILKPRKDAPCMQLPLLSAIQVKWHLRKAESCFMVQVTEARPNKEQGFEGQVPDHVSPEGRSLLIKHQNVFGTRKGLLSSPDTHCPTSTTCWISCMAPPAVRVSPDSNQ